MLTNVLQYVDLLCCFGDLLLSLQFNLRLNMSIIFHKTIQWRLFANIKLHVSLHVRYRLCLLWTNWNLQPRSCLLTLESPTVASLFPSPPLSPLNDIMFPCGNAHGCNGNVKFPCAAAQEVVVPLDAGPMGICWTKGPCRWCMSAISLVPCHLHATLSTC